MIKMVCFFKYLYVLVVFAIHISAGAERTASGLQSQLFLTVVVSAITHISSGDLLLPQRERRSSLLRVSVYVSTLNVWLWPPWCAKVSLKKDFIDSTNEQKHVP